MMGRAQDRASDADAFTVADFWDEGGGGLPALRPLGGHRREAAPGGLASLRDWAEAAHTQIQVFAATYGQEHRVARTRALGQLLREHQETPRLLPLADLMEVWEELTGAWWASLRRELHHLEAELGPEPPALPELTAYATAPDGRGGTRLKLPRTFALDDPEEVYLRVIVPRLSGALG